MATFAVCPVDHTQNKECPCKRNPLFFSIYSAASFGDLAMVREHVER